MWLQFLFACLNFLIKLRHEFIILLYYILLHIILMVFIVILNI